MVKLIAATKIVDKELVKDLGGDSPENLIMYCARVSNFNNQKSSDERLLGYCVKNKYWSVFEISTMTVKIETSRAISQQILKHRSFSFQEFSQQYAKVQDVIKYPVRRQDSKNRQNSIDDMSQKDKDWFDIAQTRVNDLSVDLYEEALKKGIAREQAKFLLPLSSKTVLYMTGNVRSWIHYIDFRSGNSTQKEHQDIALACKNIFKEQFYHIAKALKW